MDIASPKIEDAGEGAVGGDICTDPDKYPMSWVRMIISAGMMTK